MQKVFICPECHKDHDGSFKTGEVPKALIPHSPASTSVVAYVMFYKTFMGLPYYRMESAFEQLGAKIPRETMANWCIIASREYLLPLFECLHAEILKRDIIYADETTCQVLHEEGRDAESTSYMWTYTSDSDGLPKIVLYEYQLGRSGSYPKQFLEGFQGLLQCDGYQGYNKVADVLLLCCSAMPEESSMKPFRQRRRKALSC